MRHSRDNRDAKVFRSKWSHCLGGIFVCIAVERASAQVGAGPGLPGGVPPVGGATAPAPE